jgi:hypothetical protein
MKCPQIKVHEFHAKKIKKNLKLSLCNAREIVAYINECHNFKDLEQLSGREYEEPENAFCIYFLESPEMKLFKNLVIKYEIELVAEYNKAKNNLNDSLLSLILNKKISEIEHYQIGTVLEDFEGTSRTPQDFVNAVLFADNSADKVIRRCVSNNNLSRFFNVCLNTDTFQQYFYAYYYFDDTRVHIKVQEWDSRLFIPKSEVRVTQKKWFGTYMTGYIEMLAQQFLTLGYKPMFEFFKIQDVHLTDLNSKFENEKHEHHCIYKLVQQLIEYGGETIKYDQVTDKRGIRISYF